MGFVRLNFTAKPRFRYQKRGLIMELARSELLKDENGCTVRGKPGEWLVGTQLASIDR